MKIEAGTTAIRTSLVLAALALIAPSPAEAQVGGSKALRFVVGFPPGGAVDLVARAVAPSLGEIVGTQVIVDNRPGANGMIGAELVAKAPPDGTTIGLVSISSLVLNVLLHSNPPYHTVRDFTPLSTVGLSPFGISVHPSVPARSLQALIALAKPRAGKLTFGHPGVGSLQHLTIEMLNAAAGIKLQHVPYKGTGPAMTDVLGGHIDGLVGAVPGLIAAAKSGKLAVLAVTGSERAAAFPEVPTAEEQGLRGFQVVNWYAIVGPANLPAPVAGALHAAIVKATATPATRERLVTGGMDPRTDATPAAFAQFVRDEFDRWGKVVKATGGKFE